MTASRLSPADLDRVAAEAVVGFRGPHADETPAAYAQAVARLAIQRYIEATGGEVVDTQGNMTALLERAQMTRSDLSTQVVYATDRVGRALVRSSGLSPYGDCVHLSLMREGESHWFGLHFSPARARVVAHLLIQGAEQREAGDPGMRCIDRKLSDAGAFPGSFIPGTR